MTTWKICPDKQGIPQCSDFSLGFQSYKSGVQHPDNPEYMRGWTQAWGMADAYAGDDAAFPQDPDYMAGYRAIADDDEAINERNRKYAAGYEDGRIGAFRDLPDDSDYAASYESGIERQKQDNGFNVEAAQ